MAETYAGDISATDAWKILEAETDAVLVDVRTDAEWAYVGLPDLAGIGKQPLLIPWQLFPNMAENADFARIMEESGTRRDAAHLFICRSGQRSRFAAIAMTGLGFGRCYNVADGFEGPHDESGHRGRAAGWKVDGLPWKQG
ncbi:MAG: rhodanese-like domain-containing protein [Rhodospirillales bacterium]|jgi:rhodanese-related sulfurtransferase|nr:rhodanese-like domain-containing protein [Rhodospirillales bacterium]MDP6804037.1 rhodanese-like domain-containing protein [Rhodospirillales bacterium]